MLFLWCQTDGKRKYTLLQLNWTKTTQWSQIWLISWVWLLTELPNKQAMAQRRSPDKMPKSSARPAIGFPRDFSVRAGINHWICIQQCHALCNNYHIFISLCSTRIILLMSDWKKKIGKWLRAKDLAWFEVWIPALQHTVMDNSCFCQPRVPSFIFWKQHLLFPLGNSSSPIYANNQDPYPPLEK